VGEAGCQTIREEELRDWVGEEIFEQILEYRLERHGEEGRYWLVDDLHTILGLIEIEREEVPEP
jgi:hypothetical protein